MLQYACDDITSLYLTKYATIMLRSFFFTFNRNTISNRRTNNGWIRIFAMTFSITKKIHRLIDISWSYDVRFVSVEEAGVTDAAVALVGDCRGVEVVGRCVVGLSRVEFQ